MIKKRATASGPRYDVRFRGPDGKERSKSFRTKKDAERYERDQRTALDRRNWIDPRHASLTFEGYAVRWLALGVGRNGDPLSPTTKELYDLLWRRWLKPTFGSLALGDITLETVRTWLAKARNEHPGSTQPDKAYRLLRTIFNVAIDDEKIIANPCRIPRAGKENPTERPVATTEQVLAVADAIEPQYRAMVILAGFCALRFGELAGLRRRRVDLLHREIYVVEQLVELSGGKTVFKYPKSDSGGTVPIPQQVVPIIEEHLAHYEASSPATCCSLARRATRSAGPSSAPAGPMRVARPASLGSTSTTCEERPRRAPASRVRPSPRSCSCSDTRRLRRPCATNTPRTNGAG